MDPKIPPIGNHVMSKKVKITNRDAWMVYWHRDVTTWENRNLLPYSPNDSYHQYHTEQPTGTQHFTPCSDSRATGPTKEREK
ncbi:hypothetical protein TNCT_492381 [Trichonephila clavata]|uniref:Uncharacterized protein n=1 Tax=Trichonephila clavata TaxID=2740835 RepID=A0A8X6KY75_TRICU|nr:hypothetical protein TNCT_492381 [Trichonephila clavata]